MSALTTNWPNEFSDLKKLDDILQCPICYEYINTCMITSCSHNFCSVCIRKYLQYKTQCPTCSEETYGSDLRKNRPLDEIITIYTGLKEHLLYKLRVINVTQSIKGCQTDSNVCNGFLLTPKKTESDSSDKETPTVDKPKKAVVQKLFSEKKSSEPLVVSGVTIPTIFQPQKSPKKNAIVKKQETRPCPVCNVDVPIKNINIHLDSCLAAADPVIKKPKPKAEERKPLVKMVYCMLKDKELKKCLKDHGLNTNGDRKAMIWRLNRYAVLYNAECDCENPRPVSEILRQVEREEKEEKTNPLFQPPKLQKVVLDKKSDPEVIDKARKDYLQLNKDHFKELIEAMRQRDGRNIKPCKPMNRIDSDDETSQAKSTFDIQVPSTSRVMDTDNISIYSQETLIDSDSDEDMFEKSPVKVKADVHQIKSSNNNNNLFEKSPVKVETNMNQIDLVKTEIEIDEESMQEGTSESKSINKTMDMDSTIINDDDSNSYESVFDKSARSEASSIRTPIGKKHSLSARKKRKEAAEVTPSCHNMETMVDEIFTKSDDTSNQSEVYSETEEEEDESEDEGYQFKTPVKKYDLSPEISPIRTRSKRKCAPSTEEKKLTRSARSKRVKRSVSPCY